ncbi:MAG: DUF2589 domain-containing protein [Caulobacter sp.]|jgi:hypothetical protein|nr:DUF2589 domain-containing protein [Caulobacter sp.]
MLSQGQELAALDFADIIGGPMIAVINAQAAAANVTAGFIQQVGFTNSTGNNPQIKTVSFDFTQVLPTQSTTFGGLTADDLTIKVPLLTMIPIPFIRVDSMTIQLNVKLVSTSSVSMSNNFVYSQNTSASDNGFFGFGPSVSFQASVTDQNTFQNGQVIDDTYNLNVTVHAVQDQMPGGMAQILNIFSNVIQSQSGLMQSLLTAEVQALQAKAQQNSGGGGNTPTT